jgi:hypothetical protein
MLNELPIEVASSTDMQLPSLLMPYSDSALPRRIRERTDIELPTEMKSRIEADDPQRAKPYTLKVLPSLPKDRSE